MCIRDRVTTDTKDHQTLTVTDKLPDGVKLTGFIVQLMPFAEESTIAKLEENVQKITSVTNLLEEGHTPESLLEKVLEGFDMEINEKVPTEFYCNCSRERVEKALISIGRKELNEMIQEGKSIEMNCHFCNKNYEFTVEELKEILRKCK